ncbi:MAG: VanZ family protein [Solobacterium sp.]|nr:VanZ family protein [Solobacterium sp.]
MKKRIILRTLFVLHIVLIFSFSAMKGPASSGTSSSLAELLLSLLPFDVDFGTFHFLLRKAAHFSEFAVLGLLAFLNAEEKPFFSSFRGTLLIPGILVPLLDECFQLFVPERAGMFTDCLIDMGGYFLAVLVCLLVSKRTAR